MNYRNIALRTLSEFSDNKKDMTLGEIFYSIFRVKNSKVEIAELKNMSDEEIYSIIDKAKQFEDE